MWRLISRDLRQNIGAVKAATFRKIADSLVERRSDPTPLANLVQPLASGQL
jgi:hypothetical protein